MTLDDRDLPTSPENLRPSDVAESTTTIPKMRPLPVDILAAIHRLPPPNPDSYVELSIAVLLRGIENQQMLEPMLDGAVERINDEAKQRTQTSADKLDENFRLTNHEVQRLATKVGELEATVRELPPRVGKIEERLEDGDERFEKLELELSAVRAQLSGFEQIQNRILALEAEFARLKEGTRHAATQAPPKLDHPAGG